MIPISPSPFTPSPSAATRRSSGTVSRRRARARCRPRWGPVQLRAGPRSLLGAGATGRRASPPAAADPSPSHTMPPSSWLRAVTRVEDRSPAARRPTSTSCAAPAISQVARMLRRTSTKCAPNGTRLSRGDLQRRDARRPSLRPASSCCSRAIRRARPAARTPSTSAMPDEPPVQRRARLHLSAPARLVVVALSRPTIPPRRAAPCSPSLTSIATAIGSPSTSSASPSSPSLGLGDARCTISTGCRATSAPSPRSGVRHDAGSATGAVLISAARGGGNAPARPASRRRAAPGGPAARRATAQPKRRPPRRCEAAGILCVRRVRVKPCSPVTETLTRVSLRRRSLDTLVDPQ